VKRAISISIGSSRRDKRVDTEILGEPIRLERIGTDGNMAEATRLFRELDGVVDAFGVGGANLALEVAGKSYPLYSILPIVQDVKKTPIADGNGLKNTLEFRLAAFVDEHIGLPGDRRRALITSGADRWGMMAGFFEAGYECVVGDLMFALGLPIPLRSARAVQRLAALILPIAGRVPFHWLYPTGEAQEKHEPKWQSYFEWAQVIAGDCHYITRYMPEDLAGKIVVTNTTTPEDVERFRKAGASYLVTSTPVYGGRSFGTNLMEAALIAISGKGRPLTHDELGGMIDRIGLRPQLQALQPAESAPGREAA